MAKFTGRSYIKLNKRPGGNIAILALTDLGPIRHVDFMGKKRTYNAARPGVRNRIREHRLAAGLSIEDLAERVGVSPGAVQRKETGLRSVTVDELETFAAALNVAPADLVPGGIGLSDEEFGLIGKLRTMSERDRRAVQNLAEDLTEVAHSASMLPKKPV